jgi:chromosome segregation ATPase
LEKNNFLNNQIKKIKNEVQNEIIPLKVIFNLIQEKEMEEEVKKLKSVITEMENNFKKILNEKDMEFISDIKSLEKKYNEIFEEQNVKISEAKREVEKLNKALTDCKELLKNSLLNEEKNEKKISNLEKDVENLRQEKERNIKITDSSVEELKQKIKILELEVRDQNEIILKNENLMKNYKKTLCNKDDEFNAIFEESSRLKNTISQLQVTVIKLT